MFAIHVGWWYQICIPQITGTALKWYMMTGWNHSQAPPKKPPHLSYTHYNNFWHRPQISATSEIKTQRNRINRMQLTSPKVHLPKTMHDWLRPLPIVPYRAIIYAFFSKRAPMTVMWADFVYNTLIAYRRLPRRDQGVVYKIHPRNRHWSAFAEKCLNDRTMGRLLRWGLGVVPAIKYHCNAVLVLRLQSSNMVKKTTIQAM